jgi:5-methylcytosine-specific restriction endonuclease McrA
MENKKRNGSTYRWRKTRERILLRDEFRCGYCGATANQVDHVTSLEHGGNDEDSNLIAACATCNLRKGTANAREFKMKLNLERELKSKSKSDFFERPQTPPTPSLSFSPKEIRSPFEPPNFERI